MYPLVLDKHIVSKTFPTLCSQYVGVQSWGDIPEQDRGGAGGGGGEGIEGRERGRERWKEEGREGVREGREGK